jgi:ubiquinone/menaquinone biosynthesis C-methylase UbiE
LDLKEIKDKRSHLLKTHEDLAERYDALNAKREFSNSITKYRRILLSYADGEVLETCVGTGLSLKHYKAEQIEKFIGVDWSLNMI